MTITPIYKSKIISLPAEAARISALGATREQLAVLINVICEPHFEPEELAKELDITPGVLERSLKFWTECGLITSDVSVSAEDNSNNETESKEQVKPQKEKKKPQIVTDYIEYTPDEVADYYEEHLDFDGFINSCQQTLGRMFKPRDVNAFMYLNNVLELDYDYLTLLCDYIVGQGKNSTDYLLKTAVGMAEDGIKTYDDLSAELDRREKEKSLTGFVRGLFGLGERELIKREKDIIKDWNEKYCFSRDLIKYAYEHTIQTLQKPSLSYTAKILENWYGDGLTTVEEVKAKENSSSKACEKQPEGSSFATDVFFEAALKRSMSIINGEEENGEG